MFGPYEIEYGGMQYTGNVTLNEYYKFKRDGNIYLFVVEKMAAYKISGAISDTIDKVSCSFGGLVPRSMVDELTPFQLLPDDCVGMELNSTMDRGIDSGTSEKMEMEVANIALFVAQECNMSCIYCYGQGGEYADKGMMSEETAFSAVDWLMENSKSAERINIGFFGGEPLLNFSLIKKTVEYAKIRASERNKIITFGITTNASLLNEEIIDFIRDEKIVSEISFDGPPDLQNKQRPFRDGSPSYDAVYENIQKLLSVIPGSPVRATVYGDADPFDIKSELIKAGFKTYLIMKASPVILAGCKRTVPEIANDAEISCRMISFQEKEWDGFLDTVRNRKDEIKEKNILLRLLPLISGEKQYYHCDIGKGIAGITASGDIYPCHRFAGLEDMKMGNVIDYKAGELNKYHKSAVVNLPQCSLCWARYLCGGGCFYDNKSRTGDMHIPDKLSCNEMKTSFEKAITIYTELDDGDKEFLINICRDNISKIFP